MVIPGVSDVNFKIPGNAIKNSIKLNQKIHAYLIGSRVDGTFKKFSDIDLLLEVFSGTSLTQNLIIAINEKLEESTIP